MINLNWLKKDDHLYICKTKYGIVSQITAILYNEKVMFQILAKDIRGSEFVIGELHFDYSVNFLTDHISSILGLLNDLGCSINI